MDISSLGHSAAHRQVAGCRSQMASHGSLVSGHSSWVIGGRSQASVDSFHLNKVTLTSRELML